jgi:hypothetical protein
VCHVPLSRAHALLKRPWPKGEVNSQRALR